MCKNSNLFFLQTQIMFYPYTWARQTVPDNLLNDNLSPNILFPDIPFNDNLFPHNLIMLIIEQVLLSKIYTNVS